MTKRQNTITNRARVIFLVTAVDYGIRSTRVLHSSPSLSGMKTWTTTQRLTIIISVTNAVRCWYSDQRGSQSEFQLLRGPLLVLGPARLTIRIPVATPFAADIRTSMAHYQNSSSYAVRCWYSDQHGSSSEFQ